MSIVNRAQFLETVTVSFPDATATTFDVPRPQTTPAGPAYAEGTDHVVKPASTEEDYGGEVIIDVASTLALATVMLRSIEIRKLLPTAQKGVAGPAGALFPSGAPTDSEHVRFEANDAAGWAMNSAVAQRFLGQEQGSAPGRSYPGVVLRAGEFVRLTLYNGSGGDLNNQKIDATYFMGQFTGDVGKP